MVCSKCGQELKANSKFCTKCGTKFDVGLKGKTNILSYLSLILSVVGIVGLIVLDQIAIKSSHILIILDFARIFGLSISASLILAIILLYKQKCRLAFISGLITCAYLLLGIFDVPFLGLFLIL